MNGSRSHLRPALRSLMLLSGVILTGCTFDTPPNIEVKDVTWMAIGESDPRYLELGIQLVLDNPTDEPIQLETFEYTFSSETGEKWNGAWSALRTLPPRTEVPMEIPAIIQEVPEEDVAETGWTVQGTISYKAPGRWAQILFDTGFRKPTHDFRGKGDQIDVSRRSPPGEDG